MSISCSDSCIGYCIGQGGVMGGGQVAVLVLNAGSPGGLNMELNFWVPWTLISCCQTLAPKCGKQ